MTIVMTYRVTHEGRSKHAGTEGAEEAAQDTLRSLFNYKC